MVALVKTLFRDLFFPLNKQLIKLEHEMYCDPQPSKWRWNVESFGISVVFRSSVRRVWICRDCPVVLVGFQGLSNGAIHMTTYVYICTII